jgi:hypothetical protein
MNLRLSSLFERLFAVPPWAICPAESFAERFAAFEQRVRGAYPAAEGFRTRVSRTKNAWAVYVRKGLYSGFAVNCEPVYEGESFSPARVAVWIGAYARVVHLAIYLLVALVTSPVLVFLAKILVPRWFANPVVLAASWPVYFLTVAGLFLLLAAVVGGERFRRGEAYLDDVRALARSVLAADDQGLLPERVRARRSQRILEWVMVGVGLLALGVGGWPLWEWWSYWDDPVNIMAAQNGVRLETLQNARTVNLVFGAVLELAALMLFCAYALLRRRETETSPNQSLPQTEPAARRSGVSRSVS